MAKSGDFRGHQRGPQLAITGDLATDNVGVRDYLNVGVRDYLNAIPLNCGNT